MTPQRKIEILALLRNRVEKYGLKFGLCYAIRHFRWHGDIGHWEYRELTDDFIIWAHSTPYRYRGHFEYAAPPGESGPRLEYLNNRIKELQKENS